MVVCGYCFVRGERRKGRRFGLPFKKWANPKLYRMRGNVDQFTSLLFQRSWNAVMFALCLAFSRQSSVPSQSHWWGQAIDSPCEKSSFPLLHECGSSVDGMSMDAHLRGERREKGRLTEEAAVVEERVVHCEGWEGIIE